MQCIIYASTWSSLALLGHIRDMRLYGLLFALAAMRMSEAAKGKTTQKKDREILRDPFLVQIDIDDDKGAGLFPRTDTKTCTGIIIKSKLILAPCHCFTEDGDKFIEPWKVEIIAGTGNHWDKPPLTQKIKGRKIIPHPHCTRKYKNSYDNDLAFIILQQHLDFLTGEHKIVTPVMLGTYKHLQKLIKEPAICWVRGLEPGVRDHPEERPKKMKVHKVTLMPTDICKKYICGLHEPDSYYCRKDLWGDGFVCALAFDKVCLGASGAGLFCKGYLYGVDTFPFLCLSSQWPKIITSIRVYDELLKDYKEDEENAKLDAGGPTTFFPSGYMGLPGLTYNEVYRRQRAKIFRNITEHTFISPYDMHDIF